MSRYMRAAAITATAALLTMGGIATANATTVVPGTNAANPIVVKNLTDVPQGAVQDTVSTFQTDAKCDTTKSWVLPGRDAVTHSEGQYLRVVPGEDAVTHQEYRVRKLVETTYTDEQRSAVKEYTPGADAKDAVTHQVYSYKKSVADYTTQYQFATYTRTRSRSYCEGTPAGPDLWWNWSPNHSTGPQDYTPSFPDDDRGTWQGPHENGGPMADTYGTFETSDGNSPFFHREHGTPGTDGYWSEWSAYGPWTLREPMTHESWQDSDSPLGESALDAQWKDGDTEYYRVWQARSTGDTRQVQTGAHDVFTGEITQTLDAPWVLLSGYPRTVTDSAAVPATPGTWSGWLPEPLDTLDGWVGEEPATPDVIMGSADRSDLTWSQARTVVDVPEHYVYYVKGGEPSLNEADASWLLGSEGPGAPWVNFDERTVVDQAAVPEYTEYYVAGGEPSRNAADASWVTRSPGESWTLFDERVVTDVVAVAPVFYAWSDNAPCEVVDAATNPDAAAAVQTSESTAALAQTGSDTWRPVGIGIALLLVGAALVMAGRRVGVTTR
jgi:hypothetical protein